MFAELQASQIDRWLLNPAVYGVAAMLLLASLIRGVEAVDREFWKATLSDYMYGVMYALLYFPLITICVGFTNEMVYALLPGLQATAIAELPTTAKLVILIIVDDFLAYWSHRLRHTVRPLWFFHMIHHSQEHLNPFTTKRFHPFENLFHKVVVLTIPMAIIGANMEMWALYFLIDAAWDYLIHSNLRLNVRPLRYLIVTPQYHRIHHSRLPEHLNTNFSDRLPVWDHIFGTVSSDTRSYPPTGVPDFPSHSDERPLRFPIQHVRDLLFPLTQIYRELKTAKSSESDTA